MIANEPSQTKFFHVLDSDMRILVVDDDPIQREFASVYLSSPSAEVLTATDGADAIKKLREDRFDIVLIDFGMNGVEVIQLIRSDPPHAELPIIMVTSHEDILTIDAAFNAGATSFVTKPVNWRLLSYQIKFVLKSHSHKAAA